MGINNQLLCGTACVGIITLVVAIDTKKLAMPPLERGDEDDPEIPNGRPPLNELRAFEERWKYISEKGGLTVEDCNNIVRDIDVAADGAKDVYERRSARYSSDHFQLEFDAGIKKLRADIETRQAQLRGKTPVVTIIPPHATEIPVTESATVDRFAQDAPVELLDLTEPGGFGQASEYDAILNDYAKKPGESAATTQKREDSAFVSQPDPINAAENEHEGSFKRASDQVNAGLDNDPHPIQVVRSNDIPKPPVPTSFDTIDDPPKEAEPSIAPAKKPEPPTHDEVLASAKSSKSQQSGPNFNSSNEVQPTEADEETRIARLKAQIAREGDPLAEADQVALLNQLLQGQSDDSPEEEQFIKRIGGYLGKVQNYDRLLLANGYRPNYFKRMVYYIAQIKALQLEIPSKNVAKLYKDSLAEAMKIYEDDKSKYGAAKNPKKRPEPGIGTRDPKRQKIGGEKALAARGRSSTGEPSAKKSKPSAIADAFSQ